MNVKYSFGIAEVSAILISTVLIVSLSHLFQVSGWPYEIEIMSLLYTIIAVIFGITTDSVVIIAVSILSVAMYGQETNLIAVIAYLAIAIYIGHYAYDFGVRRGAFQKDQILIYLSVHAISNILMFLFFIPLTRFLLERDDLHAMVRRGAITAVVLTACNVLLVPLFMMLSRMHKGKGINN